MKIIEVARERRDLLNEGIAYIAVWQETTKNGKRSWDSEDIFPDGGVENDEPVFSEEQKARLAEIAALDPNAVLLNGWLHAWIGSMDEPLKAAQIAEGIKKHYEMHNALITGYFAEEDVQATTTEPTRDDEPLQTSEPSGTDETLKSAEPTKDAPNTTTDTPVSERTQEQVDKTTATVTDDQVGEYNADGEYIQGIGETVCFPESGMNADDVPEMITIELPVANAKEDILRALIESKAALIKTALGGDGFGELPIVFSGGKVTFNWLRFGTDSEVIKAWSAFLAAAVKFSVTAKRVTAKESEVTNEKFSFRVFLVRLGMNDIANKAHRKLLLKNLTGDAAFATPESKARWQAKHPNKADRPSTEQPSTAGADGAADTDSEDNVA